MANVGGEEPTRLGSDTSPPLSRRRRGSRRTNPLVRDVMEELEAMDPEPENEFARQQRQRGLEILELRSPSYNSSNEREVFLTPPFVRRIRRLPDSASPPPAPLRRSQSPSFHHRISVDRARIILDCLEAAAHSVESEPSQQLRPQSEPDTIDFVSKRLPLSSDYGDYCSICCEKFCEEEPAKILRCSHNFHVQCIVRWLSLRNTCPLCRSKVVAHENSDAESLFLIKDSSHPSTSSDFPSNSSREP